VTDAAGGLYFTSRTLAPPIVYPPFKDVREEAGDPGFLIEADLAFDANTSGGLFACATTDLGEIVYTVRPDGGKWAPFADLKSKAGDPGFVLHASAASFSTGGSERRVHVVVVTDTGGLFHTIKKPDGSFTPFEDVKALATDPGPVATVGTYTVPFTGG
jgi:hypothetical protein